MKNRYRLILGLMLPALLAGGSAMAQGVQIHGSVFGGGNAADVKINTTVNIGGGTIDKNVYGGGNLGDVGIIDKTDQKDGQLTYNYKWKKTDGSTANTAENNKITGENTNTGICKVTITGGTIGTGVEMSDDGTYANGNVFGAGKGLADTWWCEKAIVFATNVTISAGMVKGTVYGGGEVGRVEDDAKVTIGEGANAPTITGNVFGAGAGIKTHGYSALVRGNSDVTVQGAAQVGGSVYGGGEIASVGRFTVVGGLPKHPDSGGTCKVTIQGNAKIGESGTGHNVFGACKGVTPAFDSSNDFKNNKSMQIEANRPKNADGTVKAENDYWNYVETYDEGYEGTKFVWVYYRTEAEYLAFLKTLALTSHPYVTIDGSASVYGSVYGGGERGVTLGHVNVDITGGTVAQDVYGGGALADTNLGNWDEDGYTVVTGLTEGTSSVKGLYTQSGAGTDESPYVYTEITENTTAGSGTYYSKGAWTHESKSAWYTTHVSLTGGTIVGDAYGGGLGQKEYGTKGQAGYVSPIEAMVYGDVLVELNGKTTTENSTTTITKVGDNDKGCIVSRIFGCNNLNGTPKGKAQVYVYATQKSGESSISNKATKGTNTYDVQAVYGGGNLAKYEPIDATLIYNETNKTTVDAARAEVIIDGCALTSIKQVYGGGNAAPAPATYVEVNRCYEIDEVFGGGNGYDNYSLKEGANTVWYQNPGANVGYYTYADYPKGGGQGTGSEADPYKAVEIPAYSGGSEHKEARLAATDIQYGSGIATLVVKGGTIHTSYGGSNSKGNVRAQLASSYSAMFDDCDMLVAQTYGGGKNAYSDADAEVSADCAKGVEEMFGGSRDADFNGNINLTITNGSSLKRVFGGNNTSGAVNGSITVTIEEGGCEPIRIEELYLGGFLAPYSVYGYEKNEDGSYKTESVKYLDEDNVEQTKLQRIPLENGTRLYNDPRINVISATYIGNIFGGGYQAKLVGNPHINVNMEQGKISEDYRSTYSGTPAIDVSGNLPIGTIGNIYGGGNMADIIGNTYVEIGTGTWVTSWDNDGKAVYETITPARNAATITGNVFGGGKGIANSFKCEKAMVGVEDGTDQNIGNTNVIIGNGTVGSLDEYGKLVKGTGNVYGGGQIGRVEWNTNVTIGLESGTSAPDIRGNVFGAGKGDNTHGYAALVRGNSTVVVQNNAKVGLSVYGGGEIASVGKYNVAQTEEEAAEHGVEKGMPYSLVSDNRGICKVTVKGDAEIGPDNMKMYHEGVDAADDKPDDAGHVFGGGKGILPYVDMDSRGPGRIGPDGTWEDYTNDETKYFDFIKTLALVTQTTVNIEGNTFIKGSVYGGSENGLIQHDTRVYIKGGQIGNGDGINRRYTAEEWAYDGSSDAKSLKECAHWVYEAPYASYDPFANAKGNLDEYSGGESTEGGRRIASDGHTYYGNVFGGGSGSIPYLKDGISKYNSSAGTVEGDTYVEISGGHILTNVYGGCESTNVMGTANVTMTGGSIGVPRTPQQIKNHPVTCYLFGAGKGDQRIYFNKETNVNDAIVKVEGGTIYGSVFGGGEDGHVLRNTKVTIGKADGTGPIIGTVGSTYVDGNVFGGGRGFGGEALTAGNIGGSVDLTINGGEMLGSIYGGGRLASVGYGLYLTTEKGFGTNNDDGYGKMQDDGYSDWTKGEDGQYTRTEISGFKRGYITVTVNGGTIGKEFANDAEGEHSGNVFGGSMGRLTKLDGTPFDDADHWALLATAKSTTVNINGGTIKRSVYGGGEMGTVTTNATVNVSGGTIGTLGKGGAEFGNVYGGGKGYVDPAGSNYVTAGIIKGNTTVAVSGTPNILHNVYGGGAYGSVGTFDLSTAENLSTYHVPYAGMPVNWTSDTGIANVTITGGTIGTDGNENGMVFGSSRGDVGVPGEIHDKLAWVYDAKVVIGSSGSNDGPQINGSVYGSGENGHTFNDATVNIHAGTIGIVSGSTITTNDNGTPDDTSDDTTYSGAEYPYRGNVYGGGCGTDKYDSNNDGTKDSYNALAGVVYGDTQVTIDGGQVVRNVYGAGAMGSVGLTNATGAITQDGTTTITISGGKIGVDGTKGDGNVFGAARGDFASTQTHLAQVRSTSVSMSDGTVYGNVYGGGEAGDVGTYVKSADGKTYTWDKISDQEIGSSTVEITGGTVNGHVFGAGKGEANTFTCEKAMVRTATVSINAGTVEKNVYGGGEVGRVDQDSKVTLGVADQAKGSAAPVIAGDVFGAGAGKETHGYSALVRGNAEVIVQGNAKVGKSVYGGGEIAAVGRYGLDSSGMPSTLVSGGECKVTVKDYANIEGNVFGAGEGVDESKKTYTYTVDDTSTMPKRMMTYDPNVYKEGYENPYEIIGDYVWEYYPERSKYLKFLQTLALTTDTKLSIEGNARVKGSVYGGSESGFVQRDTEVKIQGSAGTDGSIIDGNIYGGGKGLATFAEAGRVNGGVTIDVSGSTTRGSVYGGGELGVVVGAVKVDINNGTIEKDVYGGGALAHTNTNNWDGNTLTETYLEVAGLTVGTSSVVGYYTKSGDNYTLLTTGTAAANTTYYRKVNTTVNLNGGAIGGDAYGGGLGQKKDFYDAKGVIATSDIEATVFGDITVNLGYADATNATAFNVNYENTGEKDEANNPISVVQSGRVFGCNNLNGSPQGNVTVNVYKTVEGNVARTEAEDPNVQEKRASRDANVSHTYELAAIYGGGNLANYSATGKKANVIIHTCDVSVQHVYGGGNAAAVPETDVLVKGAWEIDHVFGGGNGKDMYKKGNEWILNAGADVTGNTNTLLIGGYIHEAYGGSNEKGTIGGNVTINTVANDLSCDCALELVKLYGAGKNADIDGDLIVVLDCAPETKTEEIYGGAENANVRGNVELTITSGTFGKVFGGNNQSGAIFGHIILNIEETSCRPIIIDELYGCGNNAAYSVYGYKNGTDAEGNQIYLPRTLSSDGEAVTFKKDANQTAHTTPPYDDPQVNIISCTRIGQVFGGGYGAGATVWGNPTVNINQIPGKYAAQIDSDGNGTADNNSNALGVIGEVFGGGNEANVVGNTNVNIGTRSEVWLHQSVDDTGTYTMSPALTEPGISVVGANITGNVYGGGNEAEVTGNTNVTIGKQSVTP